MKLTLFLLANLIFANVNAALFTVCNLANSGAQFSQIDPAIAAAANGDTIYIKGSSTPYANCTINKNIKLIGPGTYAKKENALPATVMSIQLASNLNGVAILGLNCGIQFSDNIHNVEIGYNTIQHGSYPIYFYGCDDVSNIHIFSNIIQSTGICIYFYTISLFNNISIENNIISGSIIGMTVTNGLLNHNVFYNSNWNTGVAFNGLTNAVISNSIFYNSDPLFGTSSCTYLNNLSFSSSITYPAMPSGNSNVDNTNPMMENVANTGGYLPVLNFNLQTGSPAINAGNDGTNLGITGGSSINSISGEVFNVPVIRKMNIQNTSILQNGNVNVKVRSTKSRTN